MNDSYKFEVVCKNIIIDYFNENVEKTDSLKIGIQDVYIVWMCKTLQNIKALLSTTISDGLYYEITYNGDKEEAYVDVYKKWNNYIVKKIDFNDKADVNNK